MKLEPIVISLLDTDYYKFNMQQVIFHKFKSCVGEYRFKCRTPDICFTQEMVDEINRQVDHLCTLSLKDDEIEYLRNLKTLKKDYIDFLKTFKLKREYVSITLNGDEILLIIKGPCYLVMPFEIHLLEIINETYFRLKYDYSKLYLEAKKRLEEKILKFNDQTYTFSFTEFGSRRRLSRAFQEEMIKAFCTKTNNCIGTSNVYFAKKYNIKPIGTFAHEFVQIYQGLDQYEIAKSNSYALNDWYEEYRGENAIALTDTLTTDVFLLDFDFDLMNKYKGVRHDSSDPYVWGDKIITHYENANIDPKTKLLLFSDSLNFDKAQALYNYFKDKINVSFGIGSYCSNDTNIEALNIVIKLQKVNNRFVAKLSDVDGKTMCLDDEYLKTLRACVEQRIRNSKQ